MWNFLLDAFYKWSRAKESKSDIEWGKQRVYRNYTDVEMMSWIDGEKKIDLSKILLDDLEAAQKFIDCNVITRQLREQYFLQRTKESKSDLDDFYKWSRADADSLD